MPGRRSARTATSSTARGGRTPARESAEPAQSASAPQGSVGAAGKWQYAKQAATPGKVCRDCKAEGRPLTRPAPYPGPRCFSCHNAAKRNRRLASKIRHVERTYGLTAEQYDALYVLQGGRCAICQVATGASKRLAVDHDHHQAMLDGHAPDKGCPSCIRGLVCSTCNSALAHARSQVAFFERGAEYLRKWPMRRMADGEPWPPVREGV